jgi:hypothetical protein
MSEQERLEIFRQLSLGKTLEWCLQSSIDDDYPYWCEVVDGNQVVSYLAMGLLFTGVQAQDCTIHLRIKEEA